MRRIPRSWLPVVAALMAGTAPGAEPALHVLAPGFSARALPVRITNVNSLAVGPDGLLYAACYDGRVLRLRDTDGDGAEDRAEPFWDRTTLISPIDATWGPEGLYIASHLKVSLLRDDDRDGRADREEVVASGWPAVPSGSGLVDAMGLALDPEGNLYVGLGCADFTNPYLLKGGTARYDPQGELGTVLKIAPDRKRREVIATGLRFPYDLEFNRHGDLFATDQEGETWLPGANVLDELDQIRPGRHYGWPPRHEAYLPGVRDEPPVVGFAPQHQSACGLAFNDPVAGGRAFGPRAWQGDALVAGFSRGKVWRVRLARTPAGYVGRPILLACSERMVTDVAVAPSGALYISCHGGQPDWGTGPKGEGTIFRVSDVDSRAPRPVTAWAAGPMEARVAFDRPLDPAVVAGLTGASVPFGAFVRAGDRFETIKPPYKAVEEQQRAPRGALRITAARLADGGRTLVLATDPHPWRTQYAPSLPGIRGEGRPGPGATVDLDYGLTGVEAAWDDGRPGSRPSWSGWWPHLDPDVTRAFTAGSAEHERSFALLARPGRLTLRTRLVLPRGRATLRIESSGEVEVGLGPGSTQQSVADGRGGHRIEVSRELTGEPAELTVSARTGTGGQPLALHVSYATGSDPTERPVPLEGLLLPWAPAAPPAAAVASGPPPRLAGGDPRKGEALFFSEQARCSACHKVRGRGGDVGPDLSNLVARDAASVYRDIAEPSATINPDYVPFSVALKDGRVLAGVVRAEGADTLRVIDADVRATVVRRDQVDELRPAGASIMPADLVRSLGEGGMRDLLAFLLSPAPPR
ncbi:MAG TPA: PQQ-dependent sugar dehydrogenase [Isosphaeraceae bacterium]